MRKRKLINNKEIIVNLDQKTFLLMVEIMIIPMKIISMILIKSRVSFKLFSVEFSVDSLLFSELS